MNIPDLINGSFELLGGFFLWINVVQLHRDKVCKGVALLPTAFFMSWGFWNLYYYPHLDQWLSFYGGLNIVFANAIWVGQMVYYRWLTKGRKQVEADLKPEFKRQKA